MYAIKQVIPEMANSWLLDFESDVVLFGLLVIFEEPLNASDGF